MNIQKYGFRPESEPEDAAGMPARVCAVHRNRVEVVCDAGRGLASLKTGACRSGDGLYPTTGDFVRLDWRENGESRILRILPRRTCFSRLDPSSSGHREQTVAANFDDVFVMQSLDRDFNPRRLERCLTLAWQSGAVPTVLLTKADRMEDCAAHVRAAEKLAAGAAVRAISARTGYGLDRLADYLKPGNTIVLLGSSGVGKSSLVNVLAGEELMPAGGIREKDGRGRHTTSRRQLLLKSGAMVIDTPGMRELGMWDVGDGLGQSFPDVERYLGQCKFRDCRHQAEHGCAVTDAVRRGELSPKRWESYLRLRAEARFTDGKAAYLREKRQRYKSMAKVQKSKKEVDYRHEPCAESFACKVCGAWVTPEDAGSGHRNHCPCCLSSLHVDNQPGDRASLCQGVMDPVSVWVRKDGEWAVIHRCRQCGSLRSNRIAADDNPALLLSIAMKPLASPPFPLWRLDGVPGDDARLRRSHEN